MKTSIKSRLLPFVIMGLVGIFIFDCGKKVEEKKAVAGYTVTDIDGNVYNTVAIGSQVWMVENLKVTRYRNGDLIPNIKDNYSWSWLISKGAYSDYAHDTTMAATYGRLYNGWAVADERGLCPEGWHVPTNEDWEKLIKFLGGKEVAGGKMKESDTTHWASQNVDATNESGFTALPGRYRGSDGYFDGFKDLGSTGHWWSSTEQDSVNGFDWCLSNHFPSISKDWNVKKERGLSVRCIKD